MPLLGLLHLLIAIGFIVHAHRTGRPQFWMFILLFVPVVGSIAYVLMELLPELANSRRARRVVSDLRTAVDPHREWRELSIKESGSGTVEAKARLARECERKGMWDDAIALYGEAMSGIYAQDPDLMRGLARAQVGRGSSASALETLDRLRASHPDYQNQDAHLTYARALESMGRTDEALGEYRALSGYFIGTEARTRYAVLLQRLGEIAKARALFEEVVRVSKVRGVVLTDEDREWVRVAQQNLR